MKKITYIIIVLTATIAACGKKSTPKPATVATVSGKYVLYLNSDTLYKGSDIKSGIVEIINQNAGGDTAYFNPGTPQLRVQPNAITGYNPVSAMLDTLNFLTTTDGKETISPSSGHTTINNFAYSLQTGIFYDFNDPSLTEKIIKINDNTVKLIIPQESSGVVIGSRGNYYSKVH